MEIPSRNQWNEGGPNIKVGGLASHTDGPKMESGIGAGVMGPKLKLAISMGKNASIFQTEVYDILRYDICK